MAPTTGPRSSSRTRSAIPPPSTQPATGRITRLRSAQASSTLSSGRQPSSTLGRPPSSLLTKSKESIRKVSDKLMDKDKDAQATRTRPPPNTQAGSYTESLKAFLRIRPPPGDSIGNARPYLETQGDNEVIMHPPVDASRANLPKPSQVYTFDKVFKPDEPQADFFTATTLPLVGKLLKGENGLLFAYGVSNSGKTYGIQGGNDLTLDDRGVLPRSIDVVFNSIKGLESKANLKCQGLADVVLTDTPDNDGVDISRLPHLPEPRIETNVTVDRNYSYAVFVSYAEVYNEKVFDLLESVLPAARSNVPRMTGSIRNSSISGAIGSTMSLAALANGGGGVLRRQALALKNDPEGSGKYIAGLHEIRVRSREDALAVFRSGQRARQVFGTMANRESSRSHGIFTIKLVRVHNGAPEDPDSAQVSRLAIVDLAGSERNRNTGAIGDRLKEAGSINKSLMVLGQCLEVLRSNQQKMAAPGLPATRKRIAVVPFRHSKLTEIFQNFFVGDGCAVMIVHVNPYDTGFDENSHVMRFSATARDIQTTATAKTHTPFPTLKRQISSSLQHLRNAVSGSAQQNRIKVTVPVMPKTQIPVPAAAPVRRAPMSRTAGSMAPPPVPPKTNGRSTPVVVAPSATSRPASRSASRAASRAPSPKIPPQEEAQEDDDVQIVEEEIQVVEEDAEEEEDDDEKDALVEYLFEQLKELKEALYQSEMRQAELEANIREELAKDMHAAIQRMHDDFNHRLQAQRENGEEVADMKLDILQRTMAYGGGSEEDTSYDYSFASALNESDISTHSILDDPFALDAPRRTTRTRSEDEAEEEISFLVSEGSTQSNIFADADTSRDLDEEEESDSDGDETEYESSPAKAGSVLVVGQPPQTPSDGDYSDVDGDTSVDSPSAATKSARASYSAINPVQTEGVEKSGNGDNDVPLIQSEDEDEDESEDETDDDDEEGEDSDEEEEEDEDEDEEEEEDEEEYQEESSFASASTASSVSPSPVRRRQSTRPRVSSTPNKKATPKPTANKSTTPQVTPLRTALGESKQQGRAIDLLEEDDDMVLVKQATSTKKKRTLGKRIVTEDEMEADNRTVSGAEVRRMVRGL